MSEATKKKRLRWRKEPDERGLARIGQGPRGYDLWWGDEVVMRARHANAGRFYFYGCGRNSLAEGETYASMDDVKEAAQAWFTREGMKQLVGG